MNNRVKFVVDASGSMRSHKGETFPAFDGFVQKLCAAGVEAKCDVIVFDDFVKTPIHDRHVREVPGLHTVYRDGGGTNLWDAVDQAITGESGSSPQINIHLARLGIAPSLIGSGERTMVIIITDGEDTGSRCTEAQIVQLVADKKKTDLWTFIWIQIGQGRAPLWADESHSLNFAQLGFRMEEIAERTAKFLGSSSLLLPPAGGTH